ncbi:MAG: MlaD family protein, partial [Aureliella sp.]
MDEQGYRFGVGVLVVASLVIAVILILFFGAAPNFFVQRYTVTIRFKAAPGVASDTPVRKNGVQIGRVKSVQLLDEEGVDLTLELDGKYKVRASELPQIGKGSLITGDAVVEFVPPSQDSLVGRFDGTGGSPRDAILDETEMLLAATPIKDGDFFRGGRVAPDPLDALLNMQEGFGTTLAA